MIRGGVEEKPDGEKNPYEEILLSTLQSQNSTTPKLKRKIILIGSPNSGKTTLYNLLTGSQFKVVNYPGSTVEFAQGDLSLGVQGPSISIVDTPGTYSLFPRSEEEEVTYKVLFPKTSKADEDQELVHVLVVVDLTQLERQWLLLDQVREAGFSCSVVFTMKDLAQRGGVSPREILEKVSGVFENQCYFVDGVRGEGLREILQDVMRWTFRPPPFAAPQAWSAEKISQKKIKIKEMWSELNLGAPRWEPVGKGSRAADYWLLHPWLGLPLFFVIMGTLFAGLFWVAQPLMNVIDVFFAWAGDFVKLHLPSNFVGPFFGEALIPGFGAVLVFVPQIWILFFGLGLMESSGYLARAASLIDRPLSWVGLSGRSFVPLLAGFACAVPALLAARNVSSAREKWIVRAIIPLLSCSARLPVYALLLTFLLSDQGAWTMGFWMGGLYLCSLLVGAVAAGVLQKVIGSYGVKSKVGEDFFALELPLYRWPRWMVLVRQSSLRTWSYVERAGPVILFFAVVLWFGSNYPKPQESSSPTTKIEINDQLQKSYLGQLGQHLEPVFAPMGVDWRVGVGLISAFAAREVFVSSLALIFQHTDEAKVQAEDGQTEGLLRALQEARTPSGDKVFTTGSVVGLILFFMIALQCMSTVATVYKESGSWKFALVQLVAFNFVAYCVAVGAYRILSS